jgi:hypothetical protein
MLKHCTDLPAQASVHRTVLEFFITGGICFYDINNPTHALQRIYLPGRRFIAIQLMDLLNSLADSRHTHAECYSPWGGVCLFVMTNRETGRCTIIWPGYGSGTTPTSSLFRVRETHSGVFPRFPQQGRGPQHTTCRHQPQNPNVPPPHLSFHKQGYSGTFDCYVPGTRQTRAGPEEWGQCRGVVAVQAKETAAALL